MLVQLEILGFTDYEMNTMMGDFALITETDEPQRDDASGATQTREIEIIKNMQRREIKIVAPEIELINNRQWSINVYHRKKPEVIQTKNEEKEQVVLRDEF